MGTPYKNFRIYLNSEDGTQQSTELGTDILFNFVQAIDAPAAHHFEFSLAYAGIPASFYNVNKFTYQLFYTYDVDGIPGVVNLTYGYYTLDELITALNAGQNKMTFTLSSVTGKVTVTSANVNLFITSSSTVTKLLGFEPSTDYNIGGIGDSVTSPGVADVTYTRAIYVVCDQLPNSCMDSRNLRNTTRVIAVIPNNVGFKGVIHYTPGKDYNLRVNVESISTLAIKFQDDEENTIDMNNGTWCLVLDIHIVPDDPENVRAVDQQTLSNRYMQKHFGFIHPKTDF